MDDDDDDDEEEEEEEDIVLAYSDVVDDAVVLDVAVVDSYTFIFGTSGTIKLSLPMEGVRLVLVVVMIGMTKPTVHGTNECSRRCDSNNSSVHRSGH